MWLPFTPVPPKLPADRWFRDQLVTGRALPLVYLKKGAIYEVRNNGEYCSELYVARQPLRSMYYFCCLDILVGGLSCLIRAAAAPTTEKGTNQPRARVDFKQEAGTDAVALTFSAGVFFLYICLFFF